MKTVQPKQVVLIGRTNVGKSTLFNRLTESKKALVSKIAGTTRDLNRGTVEWGKLRFELVDTGGIDLCKPNDIEKSVQEKAWRAINDADMVLLVTDAQSGFTAGDEFISEQLRSKNINFILVANKADSPSIKNQTAEFYKINDVVFAVSAVNGTGTGELLDYINQELYGEKSIVFEDKSKNNPNKICIALAGLPNMGKSSLVNAFLEKEEVIVSEQPHTTREARDLEFEYKGFNLTIIDTAGVRKTRKLKKFLDRESAKLSFASFHKADWIIFVTEANQSQWGEQERYILSEAILSGASIVVAANKWDMLEGEKRFHEFMEKWTRSFAHYYWIPIIPVSALSTWHTKKILDKIIELNENRHREIPQSALDRLLKQAIKRRRPQKKKGPEAPYVHTIKQIDTAPPTFEIVIDYKDTLAESYVRFLQKTLRQKFNFEATPVRLYVRSLR